MAATKPKVRDDLTVVELDGEAVIYDERTADLHHLNPTATIVFGLCDGTATMPRIAEEISEAFGVPADEVDPTNLNLRSWVNGEPRQDSNTSDMIFSVAALIRDLSQYMVLSPGDVVNTGTPEGVALSGRFPYLSPGDEMEMEIEGLGRQKQSLGKA